jgi:hypothetical protein
VRRPECDDQAVNSDFINSGGLNRQRSKRGRVGSSQSDVGRAGRIIVPGFCH